MAVDPDSFIRAHGRFAMRSVVDHAIPLRTKMAHDVLVRGLVWDRSLLKERRLVERDLLETAGGLLAMVADLRAGGRVEVGNRSVDLQRGTIALAARGALAVAKLDRVPVEAFDGAPRLLAWICASKVGRMFGRRSSFAAARYALGVVPSEALGLPRELEVETVCEAGEELADAEALEPLPDAFALLLADLRARNLREWLAPVLAGLEQGAPLADTAARLRQAADIFEGRA